MKKNPDMVDETAIDAAEGQTKHPALTVIEGGPAEGTPTELETRPKGMVNIYECLEAYEFPSPKDSFSSRAQKTTESFYFRVSTPEGDSDLLVEAIKQTELEGHYTFNVHKAGDHREAVVSISSSGSLPLAERAPLSEYLVAPIGETIDRKQYLVQASIARYVKGMYDKVEKIVYISQ